MFAPARAALRIKASRGFSLVEVLSVLAVVGILSAVAAPRLLDNTGLQERAASDELRALLRVARQNAMHREREVCVVVAANRVSAVYTNAAGCDPAQPLASPRGEPQLAVNAPAGMSFVGPAALRFSARGPLAPVADQSISLGTRVWRVSGTTGTVN